MGIYLPTNIKKRSIWHIIAHNEPGRGMVYLLSPSRGRRTTGLHFWPDQEFVAIKGEIDKLFQAKKWLP